MTSPMRTHVYKELEHLILEGELHPGASLSELKLSAEFGVSRTPVREALMQLENEGLVKTVPNRGYEVVGISEKDIYDIYSIRVRVEGLAARRAAENIAEEDLGRLCEIVELQEFYVSKNDPNQVWLLDNRFHEILYESCGSRPLKQILSLFFNYIKKAREKSVKMGRAAASTSEHRAIVDAIMARDPDEAERLTVLHATNAREAFFNR